MSIEIKTIAEAIKKMHCGELHKDCFIIVDNDCAFLNDENGEEIAFFDESPEALLIQVLKHIGFNVERV